MSSILFHLLRITSHQTGGSIVCGWQLDVSQYFLCLVAVQVSLRVFLVDVHNNFRICARELEKYDGEAGSEDVVVTCKVVLLTNIKNSIIKFTKIRAF